MFEPTTLLEPVAEVRYAFDEQKLKRDWDEAVADGEDALERKVAVLQAALKQWPMVPASHPGQKAQGLKVHSPEMRRFVRDVLGMRDQKSGSMSLYASQLLRNGRLGRSQQEYRAGKRRESVARDLRHAVIELTTKYRMGADGNECMEALATYYENLANEQAKPVS